MKRETGLDEYNLFGGGNYLLLHETEGKAINNINVIKNTMSLSSTSSHKKAYKTVNVHKLTN